MFDWVGSIFDEALNLFDLGGDKLPWLDDVAKGVLSPNQWTDYASVGSSALSTASSVFKGIQGISSIAGTASGSIASYLGAQSTKYAAKQAARDYLTQAQGMDYQKEISTINAVIAERNLAFEQQSLALTTELLDRQNQKLRGEARSKYSAAGVTLSGSALDVLGDSAAETQLAKAIQRFESLHRQYGYETTRDVNLKEAEQYGKSATIARENAASALEEGYDAADLQETLTWLDGVSNVTTLIEGGLSVIEGLS